MFDTAMFIIRMSAITTSLILAVTFSYLIVNVLRQDKGE